MILNRSFLTAFFLLLLNTGAAQQRSQELPLEEVLYILEQRFEITFTYLDKNIDHIFLSAPPEHLPLADALIYLQERTGLLYQQLDSRFVTISKPRLSSGKACGTLLDRETGEVLVDVIIFTGNGSVISNGEGYFELDNVSEKSFVSFQLLGYERIMLPASEVMATPCKVVRLQPKTTKLQEIFITNYIAQGIDKKIDGSVDINTTEVDILPGLTEPDVLHTVQALPGIQSTNETVSDINVRGGTNDQNLVLWDGIKMYQSGHFFGLISAFNPYLTQKVTLIKNGTGTHLGEGVSSTIDIRTDDRLTDKFSGGAGINLVNGDLFGKIPLSNKASLHISGRRAIADIIKTPTYRQYFDRAFRDTDVMRSSNTTDTLLNTDKNFYFYDISLKFLYDISKKDKLRISFLNIYNDIEYKENEIVNNEPESKTSGLQQQNLATGIHYSRLWNDKVKTSVRLHLSRYDLSSVNFDILNDQRLIQENEVLDMGLKLDSRWILTDNIDLLAGYQYTEAGITNLEDINNPEFRRLIKEVVRAHAVFAEGNVISNSNNTNLRAGVRTNYLEKFDQLLIEPRLAFNQKLFNNFYLELLGEMKSQYTTQIIDYQTDFLGIEKRRWVLSNDEDIPIIKSKQISAGIHYKRSRFLVNLEGYIKEVDGIISSSQGFQNQFRYVRSSGNYRTKGIDLLIDKEFGKVTSWLSYSLAGNVFSFKELIPPTFPNNLDIRHSATLGCSYLSGRFRFSGGLNWHSGKPFTAPREEDNISNDSIIYKNPNSSRLQDYLRIDLSAKYTFPLTRKVQAQMGAALWNVLGRENIVNTYYEINKEDQINNIHQYSLGFTPNFNFRVQF